MEQKQEHIGAHSQTHPNLEDAVMLAGDTRERLPDTRRSITHKFSVSGTEGYIIVGLYDDGRPGELFIKIAKQGSTLGGLTNAIGVLASVALQYGVPVGELARKLKDSRFEPLGHTKNPKIKEASSVVDYIFRWLAMEFPSETDLA